MMLFIGLNIPVTIHVLKNYLVLAKGVGICFYIL